MARQRIGERQRHPACGKPYLTIAVMLTITTFVPVVLAANPGRLNEDFLEYLAGLEDDDDNWTWFINDDDGSPPARPPAGPPATSPVSPPARKEEP